MSSDLTVVIKTILRPEKCEALLKSLRQHFDGPVIVLDDGDGSYKHLGPKYDVQWICFEYDVGIGFCYNLAFREEVQTQYAAIMDDDFLVTEKTDMARWLPFLENDVYDVIGGAVRKTNGGHLQNYVGTFVIGPGTLELQRHPGLEGLDQVLGNLDIVMNFFAARTETLVRCPWDESLKVFRHEDWFLMAADQIDRIAYHPGVEVLHDGDTPPYPCQAYRDLRKKRIPEYRDVFLKKWGLTKQGLRL